MSPPNQLTLLRILLTPVFIVLLFSDSPMSREIGFGVYIIAALTDWYDGYVARRWGYITRWGKFFDPLADKVLTSAAFVSFAVIGYTAWWMVWIIVVRDLVITTLRSYAEFKNKPIDTSMFAKTKTLLQLVVIYLLLIVYIVRSDEALSSRFGSWIAVIGSPAVIYSSMLAVALLTAWTGVMYFVNNRTILKELFSSHGSLPQSE
jgi:CDP-diacylglycerol---glycerol-3-phosphate 3-phosphatidyltransferase